jgi:hypothetical protein
VNLPDAIPGYREAIEAEARHREGAFLRLPEFVCGIQVEPMTLRRFTLLNHLGIEPGASWESLELFLWLMSPHYTPRNGWARRRHEMRCAWAFLRHGVSVVYLCANAWLAEQFTDAPSGKATPVFQVDNTSGIARQVDTLASEYGWQVDRVLDLPLRVAFQLQREIQTRNSANRPTFFNPSDKVRTRWLEAKNDEQRTKSALN